MHRQLAVAAVKTALRALARRWQALQAEIDDLDDQLIPLVTRVAPDLLALPGVGVETAGQLLVTAGDNRDRLRSEASFARNLTSLLQLPDASGVRGLAIGRFQQASRVTRPLPEQIIARQDRLAGLPVLANVDFGHTDPRITFPIGGRATLAVGTGSKLHITDS